MRKSLGLRSILSFLLAAGCGENAQLTDFCQEIRGAKIISGQECLSVDGPFIKIITLDDEDNEQICSGTLVSTDTVLTALHCFNEDTFGVFAEIGSTRVPLRRLTLHPSPVELPLGVFKNDIALVQFEAALGTNFITRFASDPIKPGQKVEIFRSAGDDYLSAGTLRGGEMTVSSVDEDFLSAEYSGVGQNTCFGDSGGPVFVQTDDGAALAGITAFGTKENCGPGDTSKFVNLQSPAVVDFLQSNGILGR
jgi:hypothetical protein